MTQCCVSECVAGLADDDCSAAWYRLGDRPGCDHADDLVERRAHRRRGRVHSQPASPIYGGYITMAARRRQEQGRLQGCARPPITIVTLSARLRGPLRLSCGASRRRYAFLLHAFGFLSVFICRGRTHARCLVPQCVPNAVIPAALAPMRLPLTLRLRVDSQRREQQREIYCECSGGLRGGLSVSCSCRRWP